METEFTRLCPQCGKSITSKTKSSLTRSINTNTRCKKCISKEIAIVFNKLEVDEIKIVTLYVEENKSIRDIAKIFDVEDRRAIKRLLNKNGISIRETQKRKISTNKYSGDTEIQQTFWWNIMDRAKRKNIEFNITKEYAISVLQEQKYKCALSGVDINLPKFYRDKQEASLDRIDSDLGYIKGNVQWVHKTINASKLNKTDKRYYELCKLVALNNSYKPNFEVKYTTISTILWQQIRKGASKRGLEFLITREDIIAVLTEQKGKCIFSGERIIIPESKKDARNKDYNCSIDRIDSNKGYTKDNIQIVLKELNIMKWDLEDSEFINWCKLVYNNLKPKYEPAYSWS